MKEAFLKLNRLLKPKEFKTVFNRSKKFRTPFFSLSVHHGSLDVARLGLAVSKKSVKHAVKRNQIKRIVRETFRKHKSSLIGLDIIFVSFQKINELNKTELKDVLEEQWKNISKKFNPDAV